MKKANKRKIKLRKLVKKGLQPKRKFRHYKSGRNTWLGYDEGDDGWVQTTDDSVQGPSGGGGSD